MEREAGLVICTSGCERERDDPDERVNSRVLRDTEPDVASMVGHQGRLEVLSWNFMLVTSRLVAVEERMAGAESIAWTFFVGFPSPLRT